MICQRCQQEGKTSTVMETGGTQSLEYRPTVYDKNGKEIPKKPSWFTSYFTCSNGHQWTQSNVGSADE